MTVDDYSVIVGSIGVALLLLAFTLNRWKILLQDTKTYNLINIVGAGLACTASILIGFIPFVALEGFWGIAATIGLIQLLKRKSSD